MDTYSARLVATLFSISLILSASVVYVMHQNKTKNDGKQFTGMRNDVAYSKLSETNLFKNLNNRQLELKFAPDKKLSIGETFYYKSEIYKFLTMKTQELEQAKTQRKKECGTFIKYSAIDCDICILFVNGLRVLVDQGSTQESVALFAARVCKDLKIEDDRVCDAITQEYKVIRCFVNLRLFMQADVRNALKTSFVPGVSKKFVH